jgi:multidrug resistance efflux pump
MVIWKDWHVWTTRSVATSSDCWHSFGSRLPRWSRLEAPVSGSLGYDGTAIALGRAVRSIPSRIVTALRGIGQPFIWLCQILANLAIFICRAIRRTAQALGQLFARLAHSILIGIGYGLRRIWPFIAGLRYSFRFWLAVIVGVIVLLVAYYVVADRYTPFTVDAYAQAYVVQVAPQVPGQVQRVHVSEGDTVAKGAPLFELDPRPFEHKIAVLKAQVVDVEHQVQQLAAQLAAAKAEERQMAAEAEYALSVLRQEEVIFKKESTTERKYLDAVQKRKASEAALDKAARTSEAIDAALSARIGEEHAKVSKAKAELAEAELNLAYSRVSAPCDGIITNLQLREGAYAHVGQAVLTCIDTSQWLVEANFREICLQRMQIGQPALVAFQGDPGRLWPARVHSLGGGVEQGQGIPSGQLPDVRNETHWIPPAQRFQVRLELEHPPGVPLRVGMTASTTVFVEPDHPLNPVTKALHRVLSSGSRASSRLCAARILW